MGGYSDDRKAIRCIQRWRNGPVQQRQSCDYCKWSNSIASQCAHQTRPREADEFGSECSDRSMCYTVTFAASCCSQLLFLTCTLQSNLIDAYRNSPTTSNIASGPNNDTSSNSKRSSRMSISNSAPTSPSSSSHNRSQSPSHPPRSLYYSQIITRRSSIQISGSPRASTSSAVSHELSPVVRERRPSAPGESVFPVAIYPVPAHAPDLMLNCFCLSPDVIARLTLLMLSLDFLGHSYVECWRSTFWTFDTFVTTAIMLVLQKTFSPHQLA